MAQVMTLWWKEEDQQEKLQLYDIQPDGSGRLDWAAAKEAFDADIVKIEGRGPPGVFGSGERGGLTRDIFQPGDVLQVTVTRKQEKQHAISTRDYLDRSFESASNMGKDIDLAVKYQLQINDKDGEPLGFRDEEPFAANGRCSWQRCPAPLVHPAFAEAIANLALPASELEPADWVLYNGCAQVMAFYHKKEATLQDKMTSLMSSALAGMKLSPIILVQHTDGIVLGQHGGYIGMLEFKRIQAPAELQMLVYYFRMLKTQQASQWIKFSTMPCATLEVVGNELRLGAFWHEVTVCAARLGCVELRRNASMEERRAGAALLRAFLHLMKRLQTFQAELNALLEGQASQASASHMQTARPLPDAALFRAGIPHVLVSSCRWTQIEQMVQYRLYSAHDSRLCMRVALKLVEHYRPAAHRLWAVQGLAVELLEEPWPLLGGFHLLIMPLLTSEKGWISGKNVPQVRRAAARAAVGDVLERAHALRDSSGRRYVHGDAKRSNVMLRYDDDSTAAAPADIRLIDMDWSGEAGVDRYLFTPNPMLGRNEFRPEVVKCGVVMEQQHDVDTWHASWLTV